jgi:membrane associated rhomboid family serine protease
LCLWKGNDVIPLRTLRKPQNTPYVTYALIALNVLVFGWELTLSTTELNAQFGALALNPCKVSADPVSVETLLDSFRTMFLHGGWVHLIGNMLFLYIFGPNLEDYLGKARYVFFYLFAGFMAGMAHTLAVTLANPDVCVPVIGASGAIYGLMGGFLLLYPAARVRTVAFFMRVPIGTVDVQAFYMLIYFFFMDLINGVANLGVKTAETPGVAVWAHVGGFLAGFLLAFAFTIFRPLPPVDPFEYLDDD